MKIIFLDIDGVLNGDIYFSTNGHKNKSYPISQIDTRRVELLNKIIERTDAKVVLSSNWRLMHKLKEVNDILNECGFKGELIGETDDLCSFNRFLVRGNEILKWWQDHERDFRLINYVIIDDDKDMLLDQKDNFLNIDPATGLIMSDVVKAIKILIDAPK